MTSTSKVRSFFKIIAWLLIIALFVGGIGFIIKSKDTPPDDVIKEYTEFYLTCNDKNYTNENSRNIELTGDVDVNFNVNYVYKNVDEQPINKDYSIEILPNISANNDFTFFVDGQSYAFCGERDFSKAFNITKNESSFSISIAKNTSILKMCQSLYPDKDVVIKNDVNTLETSYFILSIIPYNGKAIVYIPLKFDSHMLVNKIIIDKGEILFND